MFNGLFHVLPEFLLKHICERVIKFSIIKDYINNLLGKTSISLHHMDNSRYHMERRTGTIIYIFAVIHHIGRLYVNSMAIFVLDNSIHLGIIAFKLNVKLVNVSVFFAPKMIIKHAFGTHQFLHEYIVCLFNQFLSVLIFVFKPKEFNCLIHALI